MTAGIVYADSFSTESDLITYCESNRPLTVILSAAVYDFTGMEIPTGVVFRGVGWFWASGQPHGGFGDGSVVIGNPLQGQGALGARFESIVFDGGFTVRKQNTVFEQCAFTGGSLVFDQDNAAPYYCTVNNSMFRGIENSPCIQLRKQANGNRITNSQIIVAQGQRGIEGVEVENSLPHHCLISGTGFEAPGGVSEIGSFIYGAFEGLSVKDIYLDTARPLFTDGGDIVLTDKARRCRIELPNQYGDTVIQGGFGHRVTGAAEGALYVGAADFDMGSWSAPPDMVIASGACADITLPPAQDAYGRKIIVACERDGTTVKAQPGETIKGGGPLKQGQARVFFLKHYGSPADSWLSRKVW